MATRRRAPSHIQSSEETTQALSGLIPGWKRGDPRAVAELTPFLRRELSRQLRRLISDASETGCAVDATAVVEETLSQLALQSGAAWPHRAHLMAAAAPLLRGILLDAAREAMAGISVPRALFDGRPGTWPLLQVDEALQRLADQDAQQGRMVELRLFGGLSLAEVADVLSLPSGAARREWKFARAWIYRELARREASDRHPQ
ncbi:MAG TPA: ECF-type sigma factor [Vicinamibacteria bacterium]|jgi:RNA polymerase sigma factor (TIGR02999 family)